MTSDTLRDVLESLIEGDDLTAEDIIEGVLKFRGPLLQPVLLGRIIQQMAKLEEQQEILAKAVLKLNEPVERGYDVTYYTEGSDWQYSDFVAATSPEEAMAKVKTRHWRLDPYDIECEGYKL